MSTPRGISTVDCAALIAVIAAACVGIGVYFSRAYQGQMRRAAEALSSQPYLAGQTSGTTTLTITINRTESAGSEAGEGGMFAVTNSTTTQTTTALQDEAVTF